MQIPRAVVVVYCAWFVVVVAVVVCLFVLLSSHADVDNVQRRELVNVYGYSTTDIS